MKRYLYVLLLIMSALIVDVCAQTSPTYDDKTPPAFEWGNGKMNAQKQGTPTKDEQTIINNISVTVDNVEENLKSKTSNKSVTEVTEDILEAVGSNSADVNGIAELLKGEDASGTHSIYEKICKIDEIYALLDESLITKINEIADYLNGTSDLSQAAIIKAISEELASNTSKLTNIDNRLIYTPKGATESVDITELLAQTKKAIEEKAEIIDGRLMYTPAGATESVDITELVAKLDVTLNTAATQIIASMPSMSTVDAQINYLASEAEKLQVATLTSIIGNINSNAEGLRWTEFRHANSVKAEDDVTTDTVVSLLREIKNKEAGEVSSITTDIDLSMIKAEDDVATDTVVSLLREIKNKEAGGDVELSETNNLISNNTEKLVANVTSVADSLVTTVTQSYDNGDDSMTTSSQKTIAQILGEQFGNLRDMSSIDPETNESEHNNPNCCKFTWDFLGMFIDWLYQDYQDGTLSLIFRHTDINNRLVDSDFHKRVVSDITRNGVTNSIEYDLGVADSLISQGEVPLGDQSSDNYFNVCMTVADALTMDNDGNPTHVLGRILQAVENGGSGSSGSVDLQKIERGVGVVLNEGSEGGKGEVPEMEINLVDMFYDKGTGIEGFDFRGGDSAYLDEGISMYDMTKAGLFGLDEYSNVKPLLKDMLQVSLSADSSMPKMADVVYGISSKIPQGAIASISQETLSSRIHLGNIYTKLGALDNRVDRILDALENGGGNKGVTMDTVRYSNGSHGTGDTASVLFDGTLRAVPNFKIDAGPNTSPIKDKTERVFVEFKVPLATQTFFVGFKNDEKHLRPVTGRALFEVGTQDLYIKIPSDSGIDYLWITEGWR